MFVVVVAVEIAFVEVVVLVIAEIFAELETVVVVVAAAAVVVVVVTAMARFEPQRGYFERWTAFEVV